MRCARIVPNKWYEQGARFFDTAYDAPLNCFDISLLDLAISERNA
jgi:hypothetical protein